MIRKDEFWAEFKKRVPAAVLNERLVAKPKIIVKLNNDNSKQPREQTVNHSEKVVADTGVQEEEDDGLPMLETSKILQNAAMLSQRHLITYATPGSTAIPAPEVISAKNNSANLTSELERESSRSGSTTREETSRNSTEEPFIDEPYERPTKRMSTFQQLGFRSIAALYETIPAEKMSLETFVRNGSDSDDDVVEELPHTLNPETHLRSTFHGLEMKPKYKARNIQPKTENIKVERDLKYDIKDEDKSWLKLEETDDEDYKRKAKIEDIKMKEIEEHWKIKTETAIKKLKYEDEDEDKKSIIKREIIVNDEEEEEEQGYLESLYSTKTIRPKPEYGSISNRFYAHTSRPKKRKYARISSDDDDDVQYQSSKRKTIDIDDDEKNERGTMLSASRRSDMLEPDIFLRD